MNWRSRVRRWWNGTPARAVLPELLSQEEAIDMLEDGKTVEETLAEFMRRMEPEPGTNPRVRA